VHWVRQAHSSLRDEVAQHAVERGDDRRIAAELERTVLLDETHAFRANVAADYA
jgi:hypothetical protein